VVRDALELAVLLEVTDGDAGEGAADLESLDEDGLRHELECRDLLHDTVERRLVEDNGVLGLVLDLALGPLLLLCGLAARGWRRCCLGFGLQEEKRERQRLKTPFQHHRRQSSIQRHPGTRR
jgi:hypothetical protein